MNSRNGPPLPRLQAMPGEHSYRWSVAVQHRCWLICLLSVVLLLSSACGGPATHSFSSKFSFFPVSDDNLIRGKIVLGPDGNLWFTTVAYDHFGTDQPSGEIGRITPAGKLTMFPMPSANSYPTDIVAGPDGNLWFTATQGSGKVEYGVDTPPGFQYAYNEIGKLTPSGTFSFFRLPSNVYAGAITAGPDHNVWFTEWMSAGPPGYSQTNKLVRVTPTGTFTEFPLQALQPYENVDTLVSGPDGNLWFGINSMLPNYSYFGKIGQMTLQGAVKVFNLGTFIEDYAMTVGPDNNLWFDSNQGIGRFTTDGKLHMFSSPGPATQFGSEGSGITADSNGLWFVAGLSAIRQISTNGKFTTYLFPTSANLAEKGGRFQLRGITTGADGTVWFIAANEIGHLV